MVVPVWIIRVKRVRVVGRNTHRSAESPGEVSAGATSRGDDSYGRTRWNRFFNLAGEKVDGPMIDSLRWRLKEQIVNTGTAQSENKKQKR